MSVPGLCCAVLCCAALRCAVLRCAVLRCAMLHCAVLCLVLSGHYQADALVTCAVGPFVGLAVP